MQPRKSYPCRCKPSDKRVIEGAMDRQPTGNREQGTEVRGRYDRESQFFARTIVAKAALDFESFARGLNCERKRQALKISFAKFVVPDPHVTEKQESRSAQERSGAERRDNQPSKTDEHRIPSINLHVHAIAMLHVFVRLNSITRNS